MQLCRLGYEYLDDITSEDFDASTNILTGIFTKAFLRLNPGRADADAKAELQKLIVAAANDDLGREFYREITRTSGIKLIDFENPDQNLWHCTTEFTCENPESHDNFRPDITCFVNGLPLAFVEVKIPNNCEGIPAVPKGTKDKPGKAEKMKIFLCFIQHMLNALKDGKGKGAIVVPTGFITSKQGIEKNILSRVVDEKIVYGCVSMPSNVFATTGTNVSVLFFDNSRQHDKVVLIDASKLGEKRKDGKNQRTFLSAVEIEKIVRTFLDAKAEDGFSVVVSHEEIAKKGYGLSAGHYFDVKIEHVDISVAEFKKRIDDFSSALAEMSKEGAALDKAIAANLKKLELVK